MQLFTEANTFFHQANESNDPQESRRLYEKALLRYEKLSKEVTNAKLFYNIGNTYLQLEDIGRAIVNYRRAQQLLPTDENIRQNLNYALSKRQDTIPAKQEEKLLQTLFFWHYDLSPQIRLFLFCAIYISFWLSAGLTLFTALPLPKWLTGSLFVLSLLFASSLFADRFITKADAGVVIKTEVVARQGDGRNYQPSFTAPLHAGTEFVLLEDRGDWWHVELNDGRTCWLPAHSSELI